MGNTLLVDSTLACRIGLKESILLSQINYWLRRSRNWRDGKVWVYKTYDKWQEEIPFYSRDSIKLAIRKLKDLELILSSSYNKFGGDRTRWYTINYEHPILSECEVGWKCPVCKGSDSGKSLSTTGEKLPAAGEKLPTTPVKTPLSEKGKITHSYHKNTTENKKQEIILKRDEDSVAYTLEYRQHESEERWVASRSEQEKDQIEKFIKQTLHKRKDTIRDRLAYRAKLIRNIRDGNQPDFNPISNERRLELAEFYGPPDLETLKYCTPPADWIRVKEEFESARFVGVTSGG